MIHFAGFFKCRLNQWFVLRREGTDSFSPSGCILQAFLYDIGTDAPQSAVIFSQFSSFLCVIIMNQATGLLMVFAVIFP